MTLEVPKSNENTHPPTRKKILIVEDNDLNMKLFNDLLVAHGYGTLQTRAALKRLRSPDSIIPI